MGLLSEARQRDLASTDFRKTERREWWLWGVAFAVTTLMLVALFSFFIDRREIYLGQNTGDLSPIAMRGLAGLIFLFDLYIVYQHLLIHRIRRQLLEREELFQLISENAADMIAVVDLEGHRLFNSKSYEKAVGFSPTELAASSAYEQVHPDDRERVRKSAEYARLTGIGQTLDYRFLHRNGSWLVLESTSSVIRDAEGKPEKLVLVNRDVTRRREMEEALGRSEADFRSLVEYAPYGIFRASTDGKLLQANPALQKMLGYSTADDLASKDLAKDVFRYSSEYQRLADLLIRTEEINDIETEWKRNTGTPITVRCSGRRINHDDGTPAYFQVFAEDVTEKRTLENQLRMAQKMEAIGRLSGGIAHDFNNLLGVIIGYAGVLKKGLGENDPRCEYALEIEKAGQRAASLTKQLLAFSRQQVLSPEVLDLNALACDLERMLPRLLGEDVHISLELAPELRTVKADRTQIEQVILNLAINARDAMPSGGSLRIETANVDLDEAYTWDHSGSKAGSYVCLTVTDTGTGMDAGILAHIFEPFFTTKEPGKGTGLGLATVYGIVKQSDGYIWVNSSPGNGAAFQVYLPQHVGPADASRQDSQPVEKVRGSESILLVEDAEPLRKLAERFLVSGGFKVLSARSGEEALALATEHAEEFDLLLTDVIMPGINGRVLAEKLLPRRPAMKVLYMSGYTDSFIAGHGVLEPGVHLLHKPFTEDVLLAKVREVLDQSKESPGRGAANAPAEAAAGPAR